MSGKFFQYLATATATAYSTYGLLQTGVLTGGLVGMALSRLSFAGAYPTGYQETVARIGYGRVPMEEIKQAYLSHEVPSLPTRPMAFGDVQRSNVNLGLTTALRTQAISLVTREIGVLGPGQTQGTLFRYLLSKFRQIETAPATQGEQKKRTSDFRFEDPGTWPAPFISVVDEIFALMFKGYHLLRLTSEEVTFVRTRLGIFIFSEGTQLYPVDIFSVGTGVLRQSFISVLYQIKGDASNMATSLLLRLQKLPAVDPQLPPFIGGELAYDDSRYDDLRTLKRFRQQKKEEKKEEKKQVEKNLSQEEREDGKTYSNQTPQTQYLVRRWHSLLLGRYITLQSVHHAGEIYRLVDESSQIHPLSELGALAVRLGLVLLVSGGNILPSGVRSPTAYDIGFVMINAGELSDDQILGYLKDVFSAFGFGTLEEHTNETRFISALHDEYAVQNAIGLYRDSGDGLETEDFIAHGSAYIVGDLGRTELVKQHRQGGTRRKETHTINSEAVALLYANNDDLTSSSSEEERAYEVNLLGAGLAFTRPRSVTMSPVSGGIDIVGPRRTAFSPVVSLLPIPKTRREPSEPFVEFAYDVVVAEPEQPVQSERVLTNYAYPASSPLIEEEEKVPSPPKKNRTYANNARTVNKVDAVVRVSKEMSYLLTDAEHLQADPVKKRKAVAMDARQTITRAFEDQAVSDDFAQAGREIGGVVQVLLSEPFQTVTEIEARVSELVRSRFQGFARKIIRPDHYQMVLSILTGVFEMYDLFEFFRTLKVSDVVRLVTNTVEKLFKEQTASRGSVPPRSYETELLPDGGTTNLIEVEMEETTPTSVVNFGTYPLYQELRDPPSEIEFETVDLEVQGAIERADPSVYYRPNLLGRIMAMLSPGEEQINFLLPGSLSLRRSGLQRAGDLGEPLLPERRLRRRSVRRGAGGVGDPLLSESRSPRRSGLQRVSDIEEPLLPESRPRRRSARQRANDVMRAMIGVVRNTTSFVPERMRPSGYRVRAFNRRVRNNAGRIGAGVGAGGVLWTALSYLLEEGEVTHPPSGVVASGPTETEPTLEIVHADKKRFSPVEFIIESELDVRQRDIEDNSTPNVLIEKKREALPKKRGRPRKPFYRAEEIVRQENDAPLQTNQ